MAANAAMGDAQEGIGAFLEKRPPVWPTDGREDEDPTTVPAPVAG